MSLKEQARRIHEGLDSNAVVTPFRAETRSGELSASARALFADGYVVLRDVLTADDLNGARAAFEQETAGRPHLGRNRFEGRSTQRVYALLAKSRAFDRLCEHPAVLELCDAVLQPNYLLTAAQCIRIEPGEVAQVRRAGCATRVMTCAMRARVLIVVRVARTMLTGCARSRTTLMTRTVRCRARANRSGIAAGDIRMEAAI